MSRGRRMRKDGGTGIRACVGGAPPAAWTAKNTDKNVCATARCICAAVLAAMLAGCGAPPKKPMASTGPTSQSSTQTFAENAIGPLDARKTAQQFFQLQIFQLAVPEGSISHNDAFWKPMDETFLGLWQHDVLHKNGIRVGKAALTELASIQGQLDDAERSNSQLVGTQAKNFEIELRRGIDHETVFSFNKSGLSEGHDFSSVDNLFMIGFRQVPRHPERVFLDLAPAVREQQQKLVMEADMPKWVQMKTLYDVGIHTELGVNECIVVAPSSVAVNTSTSVGRVFMMEERPAARVELVLVIVPTIQRVVEEVATPKGSR